MADGVFSVQIPNPSDLAKLQAASRVVWAGQPTLQVGHFAPLQYMEFA